MAAEFLSGFQNTLPNTSFPGFVVPHNILPNVLFGKGHTRCLEKVFHQRVRTGTENVLLIVPGDDVVFAELDGIGVIFFGFYQHKFANRFIEAVGKILQRAPERNLFR